MRNKSIDISPLGPVDLETGWPNNEFIFKWNFQTISKNNYMQLRAITYAKIYYNDNEWILEGCYENGVLKPPAPGLLRTLVDYILSDPECMERLNKWAEGCIKRLKKTVPRLTEELRIATERLDNLENADFSKI